MSYFELTLNLIFIYLIGKVSFFYNKVVRCIYDMRFKSCKGFSQNEETLRVNTYLKETLDPLGMT